MRHDLIEPKKEFNALLREPPVIGIPKWKLPSWIDTEGRVMKNWVMIASIVTAVATLGLAIVAASIPIRPEIDSFMNDISRQEWWAF